MILQVNTEQVTHEQQIAVEIEEEQKEAELEVKDEEIHNTCAVCLDTLQDELAACPCGHVFHWSCIKVALKSFPRCPVCCQTTRTYRVVKLYLGKKGNHLGGTMTIPKVCHPKALQGLTKAKEECEALMIRLRENSLYRIKYEHSKSILDKTESSNHVLSRRVNFLQKNLDETIQEKELMTNKFQIEKEKNQRIKNDLKSWKRRALNIQRDYDEMARKKAVMERKMRKEMENVCEQLKEVSIKFLTRSTTATKPDDQQQKIEEAHEEVTRIAEIEQLVDTTKTSIEALREEFARLST